MYQSLWQNSKSSKTGENPSDLNRFLTLTELETHTQAHTHTHHLPWKLLHKSLYQSYRLWVTCILDFQETCSCNHKSCVFVEWLRWSFNQVNGTRTSTHNNYSVLLKLFSASTWHWCNSQRTDIFLTNKTRKSTRKKCSRSTILSTHLSHGAAIILQYAAWTRQPKKPIKVKTLDHGAQNRKWLSWIVVSNLWQFSKTNPPVGSSAQAAMLRLSELRSDWREEHFIGRNKRPSSALSPCCKHWSAHITVCFVIKGLDFECLSCLVLVTRYT